MTWGYLPYIQKDELNHILQYLPDIDVPGRTGHMVEPPTAARVSITLVDQKMAKEHLNHLSDVHDKNTVRNIQSKSRNLPDLYYADRQEGIITPDKF